MRVNAGFDIHAFAHIKKRVIVREEPIDAAVTWKLFEYFSS
jgi:hypothetical protein